VNKAEKSRARHTKTREPVKNLAKPACGQSAKTNQTARRRPSQKKAQERNDNAKNRLCGQVTPAQNPNHFSGIPAGRRNAIETGNAKGKKRLRANQAKGRTPPKAGGGRTCGQVEPAKAPESQTPKRRARFYAGKTGAQPNRMSRCEKITRPTAQRFALLAGGRA